MSSGSSMHARRRFTLKVLETFGRGIFREVTKSLKLYVMTHTHPFCNHSNTKSWNTTHCCICLIHIYAINDVWHVVWNTWVLFGTFTYLAYTWKLSFTCQQVHQYIVKLWHKCFSIFDNQNLLGLPTELNNNWDYTVECAKQCTSHSVKRRVGRGGEGEWLASAEGDGVYRELLFFGEL